MKVAVTLKEVLTYEITKDNFYQPKFKSLFHYKELSGKVDDEHWLNTEHYIIDIEKI